MAKRLIISLREYLSRSDYNAIIGNPGKNCAEEFYNLDQDQLKRMLQVQPLTESIVSIKEVELNQLIQAFDRLVQMPEVNRGALIKQLLLRLGNKDMKAILPQLSQPGQEAVFKGLGEMANEQPLPGMEPEQVPTI